MWKDYLSGYIKNNRSSGMAVIIATFISALLLSLLCGLFYNVWKCEVEKIELEEGDWHSRIIAKLDEEDIASIKNYANVKEAVINDSSDITAVDIYFEDKGTVFEDTPKIIAGLGIVISLGIVKLSNDLLGSGVAGRHKAVFSYHPLVLLVSVFVTVVTIWISAWLPARKLSRLTPLEAIKNTGELQLKRRKKSHLFTLLFGMEGELAAGALKAQRKALRTASLSLIFSFLAFTLMQSFFTLSQMSTRETYFERYQGVWDIMVTVKNTDVDLFSETKELQNLSEIRSAIVYQRAMAKRIITEDQMSENMKSFGGFAHAAENYVREEEKGWLVNAPIVILDDASFLAYCEQIGITPRLDGAVIWNQIRDVTNPDFRNPQYMLYVKEENGTSILRQSGKEELTVEIPVLSYTEKVPVLREEYATLDYYELVHFLPVSLWKEMKEQIGSHEEDTYICMLGRENVTLEELNVLQKKVDSLISDVYKIESENRIQEVETNNRKIQGVMITFGEFCVLLAIIGIGNVFSNTTGFVRQRKREFARYMSVGMTPEEIRKMFCIEALTIARRYHDVVGRKSIIPMAI